MDQTAPLGPIAVMDAECAVCTLGARMIHRIDRSGEVRICPVQTPLGARLMAENGVDAADPETWLLIEDGVVWRDAEAIIRIGARSGRWGRLLTLLRLIPRPVRDWLYRRLARNRYRLFGRADMCALPDPDFRARLIG